MQTEETNSIKIEFHTMDFDPKKNPNNDSKIQEETIMPVKNTEKQINMDSEMLLESNDLKEFEKEVVKFNYLTRINLQKTPKHIKNRRYKKLQEQIDEEEYFSEEEIRRRAPIMFEMYVGRYVRGSNCKDIIPFCELLLNTEFNHKHQRIVDSYVSQYPEARNYLKEHKELPQEQQIDNEDNLIVMMHERFLAGLDKNFINYDEIDNNEKYDDTKIIDQDMEDEFFENVEDLTKLNNPDEKTEYTGIQDY